MVTISDKHSIFKRIGLPEDVFSYRESIFREDLFLYNCLQRGIGWGFAEDAVEEGEGEGGEDGNPDMAQVGYTQYGL